VVQVSWSAGYRSPAPMDFSSSSLPASSRGSGGLKIATDRGTLAAVVIDPGTGKRIADNQPKVIVFNAAE